MNSILKEPTDPLTKAILLSGSRTFRITSKKSLRRSGVWRRRDDISGDKNHYPPLESWKHDWNLCDCTQMLHVIINHHWNIHKASD